ncbi:MAG: beta-galactosidase [Proteobacteria bacterium]|nr:beta-galactosidase [Pseudomonadota bacterium]
MATHRRTYFTERGIALASNGPSGSTGRPMTGPDGGSFTEIDLFSGAMHYWRVDRANWSACLSAMKRVGLHLVETQIPWNVHETAPGRFDFAGQRDLAAFLDLVAGHDMAAVVRPGPQINGELTFFGFPERLLRRSEILARSGQGKPAFVPAPPRMFPMPSYASSAFLAEVASWYARLAEILAPRLAPDGPVIAVGVDNQSHMFYRLGAYDCDYHPDALAWWDEYSDGMEPPTRWLSDQPERCTRWVRFKEIYQARALAALAQSLDRVGLGAVARLHNLAPISPTLSNLPRIARAISGLAGMDFHHSPMSAPSLREHALYLAGTGKPLPCATEVGMGSPFWRPPAGWPTGDLNLLITVLSCGIRAFNLYMAVARDRWHGAPIDERGTLGPGAEQLSRLISALNAIEWTGLTRYAPLALIVGRADARVSVASSLTDPISPVLADVLGIGRVGAAELSRDPGATRHARWMQVARQALDLAGIPYDMVDEDSSIETLLGYRALVMPTIDRVDRTAWKRMQKAAARSVPVVVGPGRPTADEHGQPLGNDARLPPGTGVIQPHSMDDVQGFADDLIQLIEEPLDPPSGRMSRQETHGEIDDMWVADNTDVACSLFADSDHTPRALFAANSAVQPSRANLLVPDGTILSDPLTGETLHGRNGTVPVTLSALEVRMLLIE